MVWSRGIRSKFTSASVKQVAPRSYRCKGVGDWWTTCNQPCLYTMAWGWRQPLFPLKWSRQVTRQQQESQPAWVRCPNLIISVVHYLLLSTVLVYQLLLWEHVIYGPSIRNLPSPAPLKICLRHVDNKVNVLPMAHAPIRGGRTWCHNVATISVLWWHSKGKNFGWKVKGLLYQLSHDRRIRFSTKMKLSKIAIPEDRPFWTKQLALRNGLQ